MRKRALAVFAAIVVVVTAACSTGTTPIATGDGGTGTVASAAGVGDPCTPAQEKTATFGGFDEKNVNVETSSPSCKTTICLVNHFRGRVSCPYGQTADGKGPVGAPACTTPGTNSPVTGDPTDSHRLAIVAPQCVDRSAAKTVYCSCRCANVNGQTNDGAQYCSCGDGFACTPLVTSIGASNDTLSGSYCIKMGTAYDASTACSQGDCDPTTKKCD